MAFQSGTQIRPELANADLSGFQRAAEINAQMLAQLGQDIGGAIKAHAVKKQEAKDVKIRENYFISKGYSPDVSKMYAKDPEEAVKLMEFDTRNQQHQINQAKLKSIEQQTNQSAASFPTQQEAQKLENKVTQAQLNAMGQPVTPKPTAAQSNYEALINMGVSHQEALDRSFKSGGPQTVVNVGDKGPEETSTQKRTGVKLADELVAPWLSTGRDLAIGNLSKINEVVTGLQSGAIDTRTVTDFAPSLIRDTSRSLVNPSGQNAVDTIRDVVFQNLKNILGGAFSAKEAEELVSASYNPMLDEATNLDRLMRASDLMLKMIESKDALVSHLNSGGKMGDYDGIKPFDVYSAGKQNLFDMYGLNEQESDIDKSVQSIRKKYQK